jgi:hypothetical protein
MIDFPQTVLPQYLQLLAKRGVPAANFAECIKWCRYFLDYCAKYPATISKADQLPLFINKLKEKKQSELQCRQATYAVSVFFAVQNQEVGATQLNEVDNHKAQIISESPPEPPRHPVRSGSQYSEIGYQEKSDSPEWDAVMEAMANEIRVRHYSRKTLKT